MLRGAGHPILDCVIVGGGLAGSALAVALARRGLDVRLVDPRDGHPAEFRAEKIGGAQLAAMDRLGFGHRVRAAATAIPSVAIARFGRIVERRATDEWGIDYAALVDAARGEIQPGHVVRGRVVDVVADETGARLTLADGSMLAARAAILACGLNGAPLGRLGIQRRVLGEAFSLAAGFDLLRAEPALGGAPSLTFFGQSPADRVAYLTLFPIGSRVRANLFTYHDRRDPWVSALRTDAFAAISDLLPGLSLAGFTAATKPVLRWTTMQRAVACERPSVFLVGDAYATFCPTGGTGVGLAMGDAERLAALLPRILPQGAPSAAAVAAFYADPGRVAQHRRAEQISHHAKAMALRDDPIARFRRRRNYQIQRWRGLMARRATAGVPAPAPLTG